jgi:hypothetical protein
MAGRATPTLALDAGAATRTLASQPERQPMCRNIKTLFNFEPPATEDEIRAAALQFVRKIAGFTAPSRANEAAFNAAVEEVFEAGHRLLHNLETHAAPRDRQTEAQKAKARAAQRFGVRTPA